ncbi:TPA: DNA double-strand break repair nuclease NurA [Candidatus Bathyarchaeota archaeon]|nr:DNA double-strand break repair nuclease NurA [Candidatus Bathyarchaeota archaeon]
MRTKISVWAAGGRLGTLHGTAQELTYPKFCLMVRDLVLNRLLNEAEGDAILLDGIVEELKRRGRVHPIGKGSRFTRVAGADASSYNFPLSSRFLAIVSSIVHSIPTSRRFFLPPLAIELPHTISDEKFNEILCLRREAFLYETATEYARSRVDDVELLLIDGPLVFSDWFGTIGREEDRRLLASKVNELLAACEQEGIAVAAVVKRTTARYYLKYLDLGRATAFSDSSVLVHVLRRGTRTELFSPASSFMDGIDFIVDSFYARLSGDDLISPIRIDVPRFSQEYVDDIAGYCYATAYLLGIPLPIIKADEDARLTREFMREIYAEALCRVRRRFGSVSWLSVRDGRWLRE